MKKLLNIVEILEKVAMADGFESVVWTFDDDQITFTLDGGATTTHMISKDMDLEEFYMQVANSFLWIKNNR